MKSAVFERQQGEIPTALSILEAALKKYPKFAKLYMIQGQIHQSQANYAAARASFAAGLKACPKDETLWVLASRLEEADGRSIKSRSLLDKARLAIPNSPTLWEEAVHVEERAGVPAQAKAVLARALQACPTSGRLWALAIFAEPRAARKARSADALKRAGGSDPWVLCAVARLFWAERKVEKARTWFARAAATDADLGDAWGWWLKFEREHGIQEQKSEVVQKAITVEPRHGPVWQSTAKDVANFGKKTAEILEMVADKLE